MLFESYRKNKVEFLPEYPQAKWSLLAWGFWYFQRVTPQKRAELAKNSFLVILEKGTLITAAIGVGKWLLESPQRRKQEQYQAWQIIHLADGKTVSGARITALEDLNRQRASLEGLGAAKADLQGISLKGAYLFWADLAGADLAGADLAGADLSEADLSDAYLRGANLNGADLNDANLINAKNLTLEQIKAAKNWEQAKYDPEFRALLGLPPETPTTNS